MSSSSYSTSTSTLTSVTSTISSTSTYPLKGNSSMMRSSKDYEATFGALQSIYGFSGQATCQPAPPKPFKSTSPKQQRSQTVAQSSSSVKSSQPKDYEAAYGALCTSYGFGGSAFAAPNGRSSRSQK
ncbi:hypothetical protein PHLCEN_2v12918 [Hermanssonia centrifuga]|uniref:Uncharacterized protein n=1 Tax=Hermanssonia centrifuga TaxID=98765 RepID=A0A2R6NFU8_9APHY|nr:hypothetical protein PHLCEN_2v12918 [Hermanssonia centrifuga]